MVRDLNNGGLRTHAGNRKPKFLGFAWVGGHAYTVDSDFGVWHWQTTSPRGSIGWLRFGEAWDAEHAEEMIADHAATAPPDERAYRWAVLPKLELAD